MYRYHNGLENLESWHISMISLDQIVLQIQKHYQLKSYKWYEEFCTYFWELIGYFRKIMLFHFLIMCIWFVFRSMFFTSHIWWGHEYLQYERKRLFLLLRIATRGRVKEEVNVEHVQNTYYGSSITWFSRHNRDVSIKTDVVHNDELILAVEVGPT